MKYCNEVSILQFIENFKKRWDKEYIEEIFTKGNCYHFSVILKNLYGGEIVYSHILGHFVLEKDKNLYDITGLVDSIPDKKYEKDWCKGLKMNCIYKDEDYNTWGIY